MKIDVTALTRTMNQAVRGTIGQSWSTLRAIAEPELHKLAETLEYVSRLHTDGVIDAGRAWKLVDMQRNTALSVLKNVHGLGLLTSRQLIDAAARAAGEVVNRIIGFKLI